MLKKCLLLKRILLLLRVEREMDERDADGGRDLLHSDVVVVVVIVVVLLLLLFCQIRFRLGASFDHLHPGDVKS